MKKVLFATTNESKKKRFYNKLLEKNIEIETLKDLNINLDIEENGSDAVENALIKARECAKLTGMTTMAMDDTLYLENVPEDMQPGMYVRRVNGKRLSDEEMIEHYISLVQKYGIDGKLAARWIYGMAIIKDKKEYTFTWSKEDFYLTDKKSEIMNPGYPLNKISINKKLNKYFTDMTEEDRASVKEDERDVIEFIINNI